jgi:hypothetical protein
VDSLVRFGLTVGGFLEFYRFLLTINGDIKICFLKWFWLGSGLKTDLFFKAYEIVFL